MSKLHTDLVAIAAARDLEIVVQKSWTKITRDRKSVYVQNKETVDQIHVSGFVPDDHEATVILTKEDAKDLRLGKVRGIIVPDRSDSWMEAFEGALDRLEDGTVGDQMTGKAAGRLTDFLASK